MAPVVDAALDPCTNIEAMRDDFEDGTKEPNWVSFAEPPVVVDETSGTVVITLASAALTYGGYISRCRYDARDRRVHIEIVGLPNVAAQAEMYLELQLDAQNRLGILTRQNVLAPYRRVANVYNDNPSTFTLAQQRHFQLRETGGMMFWETSPDAMTWTVQRVEPTPFDMSSVSIAIAAGAYQPTASPGQAVFDNLNLP